MLPGVDVSSIQGDPGDWTAKGDIEWAAVKFSELQTDGTRYLNPYAGTDWAWLKAHKKGRVAYLFGHPPMSAADSVSLFVTALRAAGLEDTDAVALDLEVTDGLSPADVSKWAADVLARLESGLGRRPLLYTFRDFAAEGNCAGLGDYPLWLADPSDPAGRPQVPEPWKACVIQQTVITGVIDRDVAFYQDLRAMQDALGKPKTKIVHWRSDGKLSLAEEADRHKTTPEEMLRLAKEAGHHYRPAVQRYIDKGDWNARMPGDAVLYAPAR